MVPQHNNIGTVNVNQTFVADDTVVDIENPTSNFIPFSSGNFTQIGKAKLTSDTSARANLVIKYDFDNVVKQYLEMEFLKDSIINAGYTFMMPVTQAWSRRVKTDKREVILAKAAETYQDTQFTNLKATEFIGTGDDDYFVRCKITNKSHELDSLWLQHLASEFQKLYPQFFNATSISAGQKIYFDGEYQIGKLKNANKIYG